MIVELSTYSGPVGRVEIPPFQILPEVLVWGNRTFAIDKAASGAPGYPPLYREVCAFYVTGDLIPEGKDG